MVETAHMLTYEELLFENARLHEELAQLRRLIFGQKRERFVPVVNAQQLAIALPEKVPPTTPAVSTQTITYTRRQKKSATSTPPVRKPWPAHLRREVIRLEPKEDVSGLTKIGEEKTEELEYVPPELYVKQYLRPKYAKPNGEGIVMADLPARPIEKGSVGPSLIAHMMISKYVDHMPLYRLQQQCRRSKVDIAESTMNGWMKACGIALLPLHELLRVTLPQSSYLMVDETPIPVLDHTKPGKTHLGYYWVYYDPVAKLVFFDYRPSRSRAGPNEMLQNFQGYLQCDGYTGYEDILAKPGVVAVGCFAHARRYFEQAQDSDRERAAWMLMKLQALYRLEREAREAQMSFEARHAHRQEHALPILQEIKSWLHQHSMQVLPKSAMGKAIGYMLGQWSKLEAYTRDGRLEIDNNLVENAIRPVALGRNYVKCSIM
ncbi:IS66 family transposase [candidate division KSB1 bacterium]|nr:IS66 family transposase [candidate division KSB1 bacterium]